MNRPMVQEGDRFKIEMGRIGARPVCMVRPMTLWDTTYQKKIKEGYEDSTDSNHISKPKQEIQNQLLFMIWKSVKMTCHL